MTNAEKYLKEGINKEELFTGIANAFFSECTENDIARLNNFFNEQVQPTLTADERVILRNIPTKYWQKICRDNDGTLEIRGEYEKIDFHVDSISDFDEYNHLFQFIKERRRI